VVIALSAVAVMALGVVAVAVADGESVGRKAGMVHIETNDLDVIYQGRRIDRAELQSLNDEGKGLFTATDPDTATELHAYRAFDTQALADAYGRAYEAWLRQRRAGESVPPWAAVAPETWQPS